MSTPPGPTSQKSSNLVWWVLGILGIGIVVLGLAGLLVVRQLAERVEVRKAGEQVEISTPGGGLKVGKGAAVDPGLPVYPGAVLVEPGATVELSPAEDERVSIVAARYRTPDTLAQVDDWYRGRLGADFSREGPGVMVRKKHILGITVRSEDIAFVSDKNDLLRVVAIEKKGTHVEIAVARIGKEETQ